MISFMQIQKSNTSLLSNLNQKTLLRGLLIGLIAYIGAIFFAVIFFGTIIYHKYQRFLAAAELSHTDVVNLVKQLTSPNDSNNNTNSTFLILGLDDVANRPNAPQLSDTMLLVGVNKNSNQITLLNMPRDIWSDAYKTKINTLYEYGKDRYPASPQQFPQEVMQELAKIKIDQSLVIYLADLKKLIDIVGGVTINVEAGFIDEQFPRDDVDLTSETDPAVLYETIIFNTGVQTMNGETALKYIRSRHSFNETEGDDIARSKRQQQVFQALLKKLSQPGLYWQQPEIGGLLLKFYQDRVEQYFPIQQALSLAVSLVRNEKEITVNNLALSIYPDDPNGVIEHPVNLKPFDNQWVYIIRNHKSFQEFIHSHFDSDNSSALN